MVATPALRLATDADADQISRLMRVSILDLFPAFYDELQTASAAVHVGHLDRQLIEDRTYFVHDIGGEVVACGGWSRRAKLYTGSEAAGGDARVIDPRSEAARIRAMFVRADWTRRGLGRAILTACEDAARHEGFSELTLVATLPGVPLYRSFGFRDVREVVVTMPDGVPLPCLAMDRPVTAVAPR
ncbi:MAG TPA: GNAT family N-acetyltransferase [Mycobacteriales bacterium]|nr:GNAT family N-acetyltransferase [Mycobacteriales bacterium]